MQLGQWIPGEQGQEEAQVKCIEQQQVRNLNLCLNIYYVRILMIENSDKGLSGKSAWDWLRDI